MRLFSLLFILLSSLHSHEISLTAIFRDEAPFLKEWIEYHRLIGVEHFYLTNHLSKDGFYDVLKPYIEEGIMEVRFEKQDSDKFLDWNRIQLDAYNWAVKRAQKSGDKWLVVIDTDEFLVPTNGEPLAQILKNYEQHAAVGVNWQTFGTSHVQKIPDGKLMIETLLLRAERNFAENFLTKLIVRPNRVRHFRGPHGAIFTNEFKSVDLQGNFLTAGRSPAVHTTPLQLNHYWCRDEDFFYNIKTKRKKKMGRWFPIMEEKLHTLNHEPDDAILPFVAPLRKRLGLPAEN